MRTQSIIYQQFGDPIKTALPLDELIQLFDRTQVNGTLMVDRLSPRGTHRCFIARPNILCIEEA